MYITEGGAKRHLRISLLAPAEPRRGSTTPLLFDLSEVGRKRETHIPQVSLRSTRRLNKVGRFHRPIRFSQLIIVHCQSSIVHCQLPIVNCQKSPPDNSIAADGDLVFSNPPLLAEQSDRYLINLLLLLIFVLSIHPACSSSRSTWDPWVPRGNKLVIYPTLLISR